MLPRSAASGAAPSSASATAEEDDGHGQLQELQLGGGFVPVETDGEPGEFPLPGARYGGAWLVYAICSYWEI